MRSRTSGAPSPWRGAASPDSAGSQFFICVKDSSFLDRQYTVFGEVESGIEVGDKIVAAAARQERQAERAY